MPKYYQIALLISMCLCLSHNAPLFIEELTDSNYAGIVDLSKSQDKWIIVFYLPNCPHCTKTLEYLQKIENNEYGFENLKLGRIDCNSNSFLCVTYQIKTVPHIVKLIDNKLVVYKGFPGLNEIVSFVNREHTIEEVEEIPQLLSYIQFGVKILEEGLHLFNDYMTTKVKEYGFEFEWTSSFSLLLLISGIALMILLEVIVLVYCCADSPKKKQNQVLQKASQDSGKITPQPNNESTSTNDKNETDKTETKEEKKESAAEQEKSELEKKNQ